MNYSIVIKEEAYQDLYHAYHYYEKQQFGLGQELMDEIHDMLTYISKYPLHFPKLNMILGNLWYIDFLI
jgi:hypothetical protein